MKKALIGTSALIAVGLLTAQGASAEEKIKLGLSGNYRVLGGIVNQDDGPTNDAANTRNHGIGTDGKVNFSGDSDANDVSEILEIGANWSGSMGDAKVNVSGAYASGKGEAATAAAVNDADRWAVGAKIAMNGWALGGQYINNETGGGALATTVQRDDITTRVGLTYANGPWVYGAEYANRSVEVTATGEDEATVWGVGAKRTLGAGVTAGIGVHVWDWQDDLSAVAGENDATEFFFITEISF